MAEQITKPAEKKDEKKIENKKMEKPAATKSEEHKHDHSGQDHKHDDAKPEVKTEQKTEEKKVSKIVKKEEAVARGNDLHASMKQCMYICSFIKRKTVDKAILDLQDVIKMKRAIPFKGEIPHRSEPGMMSGRYPVNASKLFIPLLKGLKGNIIANQMDPDKARITFASSNYASRPSKRGGGRFKRTNVILKAKEANTKEVNVKKVANKSS